MVKISQYVHIAVEDRYMGPQANGHSDSVLTHHTTANHSYPRRAHTRHTAQQHTSTAEGFFQAVGTSLNRHPPRHFRHRGQ